MRNSGKALLGLMLQHEGAKIRNRCPWEWVASWFLKWSEGRGGKVG